MTVDFKFKKAPAFRVATYTWTSDWSDKRTRKEFEKVARWAKAQGVRTGKWVFLSAGEGKFTVAVELKGKGRGEGDIHVKTLPASRVASVEFDPDVVSPRVVYHGLTDWLKWRRKQKEIASVGAYREVYDGNPWTDAKAWSRTDVQVVVR